MPDGPSVEARVPLRDHLSEKIEAMERHLGARIMDSERHLTDKIDAVAKAATVANEVAKEAVKKAETATERRLEGLNELRELVADYQRTLMPRIEADNRFGTIEDKIQKLEDRETQEGGRAKGLAAGWGYLVGAAGLVALIISMYVSLR